MDNVQVVDKQCLDVFIQEWIYGREQQQILGLLFGRYETRTGPSGQREIALIYGLYKPCQRFENGHIVLERDENMPTVNSVAANLGLVCLGAVYTSPYRDTPLTSWDVDLIAPLQWAYRKRGDYCSKFVSIVISRNTERNIEPLAFMLSDQCMCMYRDGLLCKPKDPEFCECTTIGKNKELLSTVIRNDKKLGSQEVTRFEPLFFLVELTVTTAKAQTYPVIFKKYNFPVLTSKAETRDTLLSKNGWKGLVVEELMVTLRRNQNDPKQLLTTLSDFNLLIELGIVIGPECLGDICDCVVNNKPLTPKATVRIKLEKLSIESSSSAHEFQLLIV